MNAVEIDPHAAWASEAAALRAAAGGKDGDDPDGLIDRCWEIEDRMAATPARTPAGILAQVRLVLASIEDEAVQEERDGTALRNAVASLEVLADGRA
jgi:hypothetical protein